MEAHEIQEWVDKVGGRYTLTTLYQKRLVALAKGAAPLVEVEGHRLKQTAFEEIQHGKVALDLPEKPKPKPVV